MTDPGADPQDAEAGLLARVAAGERDGPLSELFDRYGQRVFAIGYRALGDAALAEELVQETFVRLWQSAERYDPAQGTVGTWVRMIARRVAVDMQRRASVRPRSAMGEAPEGAAVSDDATERSLIGLDVREALEGLSPDHREVLLLGYDEDLTQREIAERLSIPLGTVKTRTYHALRALRSKLKGFEPA